ncbi:DNA alkylation repair protein [Pedobacter sp. MC2016-15]|uniref:DNA alkylation repair protein n=1 Tax=Pedobacter sp. MC2016-15 TaxID=2994473 RepID=UPI0022475342|nr:DNA alkylation repair protein [Pedobacter sp. MC2016-15]MCX2478236.1 DNA alkylation repair protein [Pedobacter sp. MC2016-15]
MGLIKDIYSPAFYNKFADAVQYVVPAFDKEGFIKGIFCDAFKNKEWKDRMKHTTMVFHEYLAADFPEAVLLIQQIIEKLRADRPGEGGLEYIFLPDYIETYGIDDFDHSVQAFEFITQFISCEFAVRPFILKFSEQMIREMLKWSNHKTHTVRRLASEGSRPRLPWAMAIPFLKQNPQPILPILENLKTDPSESVRRSVANSLNDIAKDHPDVVIAVAARWQGISKETDAIIKHGCRTLLKQGHSEILKQYGLDSTNITVEDFRILSPEVKIGESVEFEFSITNQNPSNQTVRLEYGLYYQKSKGHLARKVFKISEKIYEPGVRVKVNRKQSFRLITTRIFHPGEHQVSIIVNGVEKGVLAFNLSA